MAGFDVIDLINESTACTLAFVSSQGVFDKDDKGSSEKAPSPHGFVDKEPAATILCVDLGAAKLDVGVYQWAPVQGVLTTRAVHGLQSLGGADWDERLADLMADQMVANDGTDPRQTPAIYRQIIRNCELAKRQLAQHGESLLRFNTASGAIQLKMTADRFITITHDLNQTLVRTLVETLEQAECDWGDVDTVLLSGTANASSRRGRRHPNEHGAP